MEEKYSDWSLHIYGSRYGDMGVFDQLRDLIDKSQIQNVCLHPAQMMSIQNIMKAIFMLCFLVMPPLV